MTESKGERRVGAVGLAAVLLLTLLSPARAQGQRPGAASGPFADDTAHGCLEPVPQTVGVRNVTDHGQGISLDVLVLLDGITKPRAVEVLGTASEAYEPLGIGLRNTFRHVRFNNSGEYQEMERAALGAVGGKRPPGFDLVYVMTSKDLHNMGDYGIAGFAFCVGGVRNPKVAFAIGEGLSPLEASLNDESFSAKIAAHEMGHLLGAHHHYGNCAEGDRRTEGGGEPSVCTLMWGAQLSYVALNFGTLEAAVIRGYAVDFASP